MRRFLATLGIALSLAPAGASACGGGPFPELDYGAMGYRWMTAKGRGLYVQKISRRQLKAMTAVIRDRQLFGFAR